MSNAAYEIERKRELNTTVELFLETLKNNGFVPSSSLSESDTYYSRPDVDYMETVECLRIRVKGDYSEITYKPASTSKTKIGDGVTAKRETNVALKNISDAEIAKELFLNIGLIKLIEVNKSRLTFKSSEHPDVLVSVDTIEHAGIFVETEVMSPDRDTAVARIEAIEKTLNIHTMEIVSLPYRDLVMNSQA